MSLEQLKSFLTKAKESNDNDSGKFHGVTSAHAQNKKTQLDTGFCLIAYKFAVDLNLLWFLAANLFNGVGVGLDKRNHLHSQNTGFESIASVVAAFNSSTAGLAVSDCIALMAFHGLSHGVI